MISIIVSSYREHLLKDLKDNLRETTTVPYEIVPIINRHEMSLTQAYNRGARRARYNYLCFMHEDIKIHTNGWAKKLIDTHQNIEKAGVLGLAGSTIKPDLPTGVFCFLPGKDFYYGIRHTQNGVEFGDNIKDKEKVKVKILDGAFLFTHQTVWKTYPFNEKVEGFHFYDIDFSLRASESFENFVTSKVLTEHFSPGSYGGPWADYAIKFHKIFKDSPLLDKVDNPVPVQQWMYTILSTYSIPFRTRLQYINMMGFTVQSFPLAWKFLGLHQIPGKFMRLLLRKENG